MLRRIFTRETVELQGSGRRLDAHESLLARTLTPHARGHFLLLLGVHPGLALTSARRTRLGNRRVGGVPNSFHLQGRAVDLTGSLPLLQEAAALAWRQRLGPHCTGPEEVLLEFAGTARQHLHVAW